MKKHRLFISSKKDLKALNKKISIDSLFSVGETITNNPLVIGENVISDKRILDSFNEFMNYGKVSGVLIIEEIQILNNLDMGTKEKIKNWLEAEYNSLHLEHISEQKESELKDRFIRFYCKFDKRLMRIKREKISVSPIKNGGVRLSLVAWGKCYGQFYEV